MNGLHPRGCPKEADDRNETCDCERLKSGGISDKATQSLAIVDQIRPLLAGKGADVQGAVLIELVATWLAGHHPDTRSAHALLFFDAVVDMVPACEAEMLATRQRPEGWG